MAAQDYDTCPHCEGQGAYWDDQTGQPDEPNGGRMITCWMCEGAGIVDTSPCIACGAPVYDHEEDCPVLEYQRNGAVKGEVRA
jgi:DnaJ-class molecular chaperone